MNAHSCGVFVYCISVKLWCINLHCMFKVLLKFEAKINQDYFLVLNYLAATLLLIKIVGLEKYN